MASRKPNPQDRRGTVADNPDRLPCALCGQVVPDGQALPCHLPGDRYARIRHAGACPPPIDPCPPTTTIDYHQEALL